MTTETIKTTIHTYRFDTREPDEAARYKALCERLKGQGLTCFETWGGESHYTFVKDIDGQEIELQTRHLFDNQWNTAPIPGRSEKGLRVFDWAQDYPAQISEYIKRGHYLAQTKEMGEVRRNRAACGYCGRQEPAAKGYVFCPHCLDSPYLAEDELHLTRMLPVTGGPEEREPLTDAERQHLLPLYVEAQTVANGSRAKAANEKRRRDIVARAEKTIKAAETERDGMLWLMDNGINVENCIYYSHTDCFGFGWREPVSPAVESAILDVISEFPFRYEIKCADGRKLNNY